MKLFCISDVHGFYDKMIEALNKAGFEANSPDHKLLILGDCFDRGSKPHEVMTYLMGLNNVVLIRGNHEDLLLECIERKYILGHDYSNGTANTIMDLADAMFGYSKSRPFAVACELIEDRVKAFTNQMVNYYETKNHIFVHSWVPLQCLDDMPKYYIRGKVFDKMENWREADNNAWEDARWGNPFDLAKKGLLPDKTLVFGHFHTSWARAQFDGQPEWSSGANFSPYYGDGYIGIDGCTAYTGKVNILILEDELI